MDLVNFLFLASGWVFAVIVNVVWLIVCVRLNNTWYETVQKVRESLSEFLSEMNEKYADFCRQQNEDWFELTTKTIEGGTEDDNGNEEREE